MFVTSATVEQMWMIAVLFRYTWCTYLQRNRVNSSTTIDLMRHSDRKLTDIINTDSNLLQTGEVIRNLPDDKKY